MEDNNHGQLFHAVNPVTGKTLSPAFSETSAEDIDKAVREADSAFKTYRNCTGEARGRFLRAIGTELRKREAELVARCGLETGLPEVRLQSELTRTVQQLNLFADLLSEGSWVNARIDHAVTDRKPVPRPDIRQVQVALGPVGIFGASNFPFAFSVAGGDTASALAAGCPVVFKAHHAHPGTSDITAEAIRIAISDTGMPTGVFSLLHGKSNATGMALVTHAMIKAIGFTGSTKGGLALVAAAAARPEPIPVYAEMGSSNPVFILPGALRENKTLAASLVASVTLGAGQFCTNPGIVAVIDSPAGDEFLQAAGKAMTQTAAATMLTAGIRGAYEAGVTKLGNNGAGIVAKGAESADFAGTTSYLLQSPISRVLNDPGLADEVFGPSSLVLTAENKEQLLQFAESLSGHLTATVHGLPHDFANFPELLQILEQKVGRLIINGFPTGVEVCPAMVHGGPFPASSDARTTSVGTAAIYRFTRPVCYQGFPDELLPPALRENNPLKIRRLINGAFTNN